VAAGVGWQSAGWLKGGEGLTRWLASAGRAAISNTVTQGLSVVLGLKPEFKWSELVASALSAGIGAAVNAGAQRLIEPLKLGRMGEVMASTLGGIAGARAALAYRGGILDVRQIAADAFGNALANSLVESLPATAAMSYSEAEAKADTERELKRLQSWTPETAESTPWTGQGLRPSARSWAAFNEGLTNTINANQQARQGTAANHNGASDDVLNGYVPAGLDLRDGIDVAGGGRGLLGAELAQRALASRRARDFDSFRKSEISAGNAMARLEEAQTTALLPGAKANYVLFNKTDQVIGPQGTMTRDLFGRLLHNNPDARLEVLGSDPNGLGLSVQLRQPALERDSSPDPYAGERRLSIGLDGRAYSPLTAYTSPSAVNPWSRGIALGLDDTATQSYLKAEEYANQRTLEIGLSLTGIAATPFRLASGIERLWGLGGLRGEVSATAGNFGRSFWVIQNEFEGIKVFPRNDVFDPNLMTMWREGGKVVSGTNLDRMLVGRAPIGIDGKPVNLHHILQSNNSAIAEMTQTFHQQNSRIIHINPHTIPSGINRSEFDAWKARYWANRADNYGSK